MNALNGTLALPVRSSSTAQSLVVMQPQSVGGTTAVQGFSGCLSDGEYLVQAHCLFATTT